MKLKILYASVLLATFVFVIYKSSLNSFIIYDTKEDKCIDYGMLIDNIGSYNIILLGEEHLSVKQHELQLRLIEDVNSRYKVTRLVMEMIYPQQQKYIEALKSKAYNKFDIDEYFPYITKWNDNIWPWGLYKDVVLYAMKNNIELVFGNLSTSEKSNINNNRAVIGSANLNFISSMITQYHGVNNIKQKITVQKSVDEKLARNSAVISKGKTVVIAGNNHIRKDIAAGSILTNKYNLNNVTIGMELFQVIKGGDSSNKYNYLVSFFDSAIDYNFNKAFCVLNI